MNQDRTARIRQICRNFKITGEITEVIPWGNGLINDTFRVNTDAGEDYLLQRVNEQVYPDLDGMMGNILRVTEFINRQTFYLPDGQAKQSLHVIPTVDGKPYFRDAAGSCFRIYNFMQNTYCMEVAEDPEKIGQAGVILGQFHYLLRDFPVSELAIIIPDFHHPIMHYEKLLLATLMDRAGHLSSVEPEIDFFTRYSDLYEILSQAHEDGRLPLRVNHNDAKINNIMFDAASGEPLCMVDLDTVMPGLLPYDFGDAIRSCMCTGRDGLCREHMPEHMLDMASYEAYRKGFLAGCQGILTPAEEADLPAGALLIAAENGMRYLTDYLNGNIYFKVKYPEQNLVKARMHMRLAEDLLDCVCRNYRK